MVQCQSTDLRASFACSGSVRGVLRSELGVLSGSKLRSRWSWTRNLMLIGWDRLCRSMWDRQETQSRNFVARFLISIGGRPKLKRWLSFRCISRIWCQAQQANLSQYRRRHRLSCQPHPYALHQWKPEQDPHKANLEKLCLQRLESYESFVSISHANTTVARDMLQQIDQNQFLCLVHRRLFRPIQTRRLQAFKKIASWQFCPWNEPSYLILSCYWER